MGNMGYQSILDETKNKVGVYSYNRVPADLKVV